MCDSCRNRCIHPSRSWRFLHRVSNSPFFMYLSESNLFVCVGNSTRPQWHEDQTCACILLGQLLRSVQPRTRLSKTGRFTPARRRRHRLCVHHRVENFCKFPLSFLLFKLIFYQYPCGIPGFWKFFMALIVSSASSHHQNKVSFINTHSKQTSHTP
jgi:hypothetical protein